MLKGQVLKPWAHSSGVHVESGRGESLRRKQAVLGHRGKPEGRWQEHHPHEVVQSGKLPGSRGGRLKRTWTGGMEAADNHPRA